HGLRMVRAARSPAWAGRTISKTAGKRRGGKLAHAQTGSSKSAHTRSLPRADCSASSNKLKDPMIGSNEEIGLNDRRIGDNVSSVDHKLRVVVNYHPIVISDARLLTEAKLIRLSRDAGQAEWFIGRNRAVSAFARGFVDIE